MVFSYRQACEKKKMTFNIEDALASLPASEQSAVRRRVNLVHMAQRQKGMEPRKDSLLTWKFATGELDHDTPSAIANELAIVDHIYKSTSYGSIIEEAMRMMALELRQRYRLSWTTAWDVTRFYVPTMLKLHYLSRTECPA